MLGNCYLRSINTNFNNFTLHILQCQHTIDFSRNNLMPPRKKVSNSSHMICCKESQHFNCDLTTRQLSGRACKFRIKKSKSIRDKNTVKHGEETPKILGILEIPLTIIEAHSNQVCMHGVHIQTHHTVLCVVNVPNEIKSGVNHMNHRKPNLNTTVYVY